MSTNKSSNQIKGSTEAPLFREGLSRGLNEEGHLNCDMGEGMGNDALIMPYISSANIACGYHAGDVQTMYDTIELAVKYNVAVGAHVSYLDRNNFGRTEMNLEEGNIYELVQQQLIIINEIIDLFDIKLTHVKPHGALYNQSAKNSGLAKTIAAAVKDFDPKLILFGLSGSYSIREAEALGLKTANEVFADRRYQDDGSLTARGDPTAMIEDVSEVVKQVLQMINNKTITTVSGKTIPAVAETICIHGDGKHAAEFAKAIYDAMHKKE
ncbi:MAG: 5-oxoprolinase subunit PxpA [Chitinophagaceae bacterium]